MPPDADVVDYIRSHVPKGEDYTPYVSKGERDQERWLWEFFKLTGVFEGLPGWKSFKEHIPSDEHGLDWFAEAWWAMQYVPDTFRRFYDQLYAIVAINRTYILVD